MINLEEWDLDENQIRTLSPLISKLVKLERLNLGRNPIGRLPNEVATLPNLKTIYSEHRRLRISDEILQSPSITNIVIAGRELKK